MLNNNKFDYNKLKGLIIIVLIIIFYKHVINLILPFFIGYLMAGLANPAVKFLEQRAKLPRALASLVAVAGELLIGGYLIFAIASNLIQQLSEFTTAFPNYGDIALQFLIDLTTRLQEFTYSLPTPYRQGIEELVSSLIYSIQELAQNLVSFLQGTMSWVPGFVVFIIISVLAAYFISKDKDVLPSKIARSLSPQWQEKLVNVMDRLDRDLVGFVAAEIILFGISTVISIVWLLQLKVKFWLILSVCIGILDMIPAIGPGIIIFPWAIYALFIGEPAFALSLLILYGVIFITHQVLFPKLLGDTTNTHPLLMLAGIYGGYLLLGPMGLIFGPLIILIIKALWNAGVIGPSSGSPPPESS